MYPTDKENLFIIFPPGGGGNHLRNLLTKTDRFYQDEIHESMYVMDIKNAHFSNIRNLQYISIKENLESLLHNQNNVFCGHIGEYIWLMQNELSEYFKNPKFLIVELPNNDSIAKKRMLKLYPAYKSDFFYSEQKTLYSQMCLSRLFEQNDFFQINCDDIFCDTLDPIISLIENQLCTKFIDPLKSRKIHDIWYKSILKDVNKERAA
jgi:hypothetical protein